MGWEPTRSELRLPRFLRNLAMTGFRQVIRHRGERKATWRSLYHSGMGGNKAPTEEAGLAALDEF
ncbi:MAG: hypothetical protein ACLFQV_10165 [Vulcanimicrobiota bacterium]